MKKLIMGVLIVIILGLYFFTDETKGVLRKATGFVISEGKEKIKDVVNNTGNIALDDMNEEIEKLIKDS